MTMLGINVPAGVSFSTQKVTLDGAEFQLSLSWNQRESFWYLGLADADGVAILSPRKLVANWPMLRLVTDSRRPPGEICAVDMSGSGDDPGFTDLGSRHLLVYTPVADLP